MQLGPARVRGFLLLERTSDFQDLREALHSKPGTFKPAVGTAKACRASTEVPRLLLGNTTRSELSQGVQHPIVV